MRLHYLRFVLSLAIQLYHQIFQAMVGYTLTPFRRRWWRNEGRLHLLFHQSSHWTHLRRNGTWLICPWSSSTRSTSTFSLIRC